ncbi:MAG: oxygen-independent coproporphyrinogen III oxidase [Mesorhizobium sp.]
MHGKKDARLDEAVPRYTSYPTAPHFHSGVTGEAVREWIAAIPDGDTLSLYLHVPFCDRLCWFCACHTKQTRQYDPVAAYVTSLCREIETVGSLVAGRAGVGAIHFGGGSPTMLAPSDIHRLGDALRGRFVLASDAEISVEIDPNDMTPDRLDALAAIGMTRASLGVQDFDPKVQAAINREQSFESTRDVVEGLRARGVGSVNLDLLYGLPHQDLDTLAATVAQALSLSPDRIALFGYAHVPWFKKHQTMIPEEALPGSQERYEQAQMAAAMIEAAGYQRIGLDHYAKPDDGMAVAARDGRLKRNFQGYTEDACETLIGLGASSISRYRQGHAQNQPATGVYQRMVDDGGLATVRGVAFSEEDRARGWVIENLMCNFAFDAREAKDRFGAVATPLVAIAAGLAQGGKDPVLRREDDLFVVPEHHRPLVRTVAARFDAYLETGQARHSVAV